MDRATAQRVICEYLSGRFGIEREELSDEARFQEDLGLDSLEVTELLVGVEDQTGTDLGLARLTTIDDVTSIGALAVALSRATGAPPETTTETRNA
jgi:acyl carrier protein